MTKEINDTFIIEANEYYLGEKIKFTSKEVGEIEQAENNGKNFPFSERWDPLPQKYKIAYFERQKWVKEGKQGPEPERITIRTILETITEEPGEALDNVRDSLIEFEDLERLLKTEFEKAENAKLKANQTEKPSQPSRIPKPKSTQQTVTSEPLKRSCSYSVLNGHREKKNLNHPGANLDQKYQVDTRWTDPESPIVLRKPSLLFRPRQVGSISAPNSPTPTRKIPVLIRK